MIDRLPDAPGEIAENLGVPVEKVQPFLRSLRERFGQGRDQMTVLIEVAREHGVPVDRLKAVFRDAGKGDFENPAEDLAELLARGLFGGTK